MINLNTLMYGEEYPIIDVIINDDKIELCVESKITNCKCPKCNENCEHTHNVHKRYIQDTPIHNKETWISLTTKEFKCTNSECKIKTFTEILPFCGVRQVMTNYLKYFIVTLAIYMSSSATSLILSLIGVKISADTIDNLLKNIEIKDDPDVEEIGIDDVALRKGMSYATAIYNLKTHQLIALIKGREKEDIIPWLKEHPKIKVVARDRASAYAQAVSEVFPNAIQIADRFHLFQNLTSYLKDILYANLPDKIVLKNGQILDKKATKVLKELSNIDNNILESFTYDNTPPLDKEGKEINFISIQQNLNSKQYIRQAENRIKKYNDIIALRKEKLNIEELVIKYNYSKSSIKKYLNMSDEEVEKIKERRNYKRKESEIIKYSNIIYKMLVDNIEINYIITYVLKLGFKNSIVELRSYIYNIATNNNLRKVDLQLYNKYEYSKDETIITRYELFKYILTLDENKDKNDIIKENILILKEKFPIINNIEQVFKDFHTTIFSNDANELDKFIEKYINFISSFCKGLKKDIAAVKNAISNKINSGFVEGNNNKFKLIKRIVYGKQKLVNLFKRCWLNFSSTLDNLDELKLAISPFVTNNKKQEYLNPTF